MDDPNKSIVLGKIRFSALRTCRRGLIPHQLWVALGWPVFKRIIEHDAQKWLALEFPENGSRSLETQMVCWKLARPVEVLCLLKSDSLKSLRQIYAGVRTAVHSKDWTILEVTGI